MEGITITNEKLSVYPDIGLLRQHGIGRELTLVVRSTLGKGKQKWIGDKGEALSNNKRGIMIESKWKLNSDDRTITCISSCLITRFRKEPLLPSEIPDRHLRSIRELGAEVFNTRPFRGLRLYTPLVENTLILAERKRVSRGKDTESPEIDVRVFISHQDVELWRLQRDDASVSTSPVSPQRVRGMFKSSTTIPQIIRSAQESSLSLRYEFAQLVEQVITGLAAIRRLLVLKERGLDQEMIDHICESVLRMRESPLEIDSIMKKIKELFTEEIL